MIYSSQHVVTLFNVSRQTVSDWSEEFARWLSPGANPSKGGHRRFTEKDMRVFSLVAQMRASALGFSDIHASLSAGQLGDMPEPNIDSLAISGPAQVSLLQQTVSSLERRIGELNELLRLTEESKAETRGENLLLKEQLRQALEKIDTLNRQIGRLERDTD